MKTPTDPLRARILELTQDLNEKVTTLRDYATTPGNAWLAKGEIQSISAMLSDIETIVEQIQKTESK
ncbi:MAG: hypothetical protein ABIS59_01665 [Candidatus Saccharibacteria bacterium]